MVKKGIIEDAAVVLSAAGYCMDYPVMEFRYSGKVPFY